MAADEAGMGAHIRFYDGGQGAGFTAHEARPGDARLLTRQGWGHTFGFARGLHRGDASAKGNRKCKCNRKIKQQKTIANAISRLNAGANAMAESKAVAKAGDKFFKS